LKESGVSIGLTLISVSRCCNNTSWTWSCGEEELQPHELLYLDSIKDNSLVYQNFRRLCGYFRGKHDIEEILWRGNIDREDLDKILKTYSDILVTCTHELPSPPN